MMDFKIVNGILNWDDGSCMPATDEHLAMWEKINQLQAEVERLKLISVKDRLPTEAGKYLCMVLDSDGHYYSLEWYLGGEWGSFYCEVTHWMPLPEPPAGEQAND